MTATIIKMAGHPITECRSIISLYHLIISLTAGVTSFLIFSGLNLPVLTGNPFHFPDLLPYNYFLFIAAVIGLIIQFVLFNLNGWNVWFAPTMIAFIGALGILLYNCWHTLTFTPGEKPAASKTKAEDEQTTLPL